MAPTLGEQSSEDRGKPTLVLGIDGTLVCSGTLDDHDLEVAAGGHFVKMRPGLSKFLQDMSQVYEIVFFTAASRGYAEDVLARLTNGLGITWSLFSNMDTEYVVMIHPSEHEDNDHWWRFLGAVVKEDDTIPLGNHRSDYLKDLRKLGRDLRRVVWIDDTDCFYYNLHNGFICTEFTRKSQNDQFFSKATPFLLWLAGMPDVQQIFRANKLQVEELAKTPNELSFRVCKNLRRLV